MFPPRNTTLFKKEGPILQNRSGWFLVLGLVLIVVFYMEFMYLILAGWALLIVDSGPLTLRFKGVMQLVSAQDTPLSMVVTLSTFFGMMASVGLTTYITRGKSPLSLLGKRPIWRNMLLAAGILAGLATINNTVMHFAYDMQPNLPFATWMGWLPVAVPLLFVQITAEELVFRGYLQQELAARYSSRWIWMLVPSLIFGSLHWDSEQFGPNAWLIVAGTTLFGLIAADITARTGNLGAAIGLHFVNNFSALFISTIDGSMTGLSLYLTPFTSMDHNSIRNMLLWDIGLMALYYGIFLAVVSYRHRR